MSAILSPCGRYRYALSREWLVGDGRVCFVMLNPSTATADTDDPTIRRCVGFAQRWGFAALDVVNLFAWRETSPARLRVERELGRDIVGPENDEHIRRIAASARHVVLAWGSGVHSLLGRRGDEREFDVMRMLEGCAPHVIYVPGKPLQPRHPIYLRGDATTVPFGQTNTARELRAERSGS